MEPERKIERLLRAYAKKRRAEAGDPLKLHPANRRLLQGEAGRRAPEPGEGGLFLLLLAVFRRRLVFALCILSIGLIGTLILLSGLVDTKRKVQSMNAMNSLKEIGAASRQFAKKNKDVLPASLDEMTNGLVMSKDLIDPLSGKPFVYAGAGRKLDEMQSNEVLVYSPADKKSHAVLFADGRVETVTSKRLAELTNQNSLELALADQSARERPVEVPPATAPAPPGNPASALFSTEKTKIILAKEETKAGDLGVNAPTAGGSAGPQPELAESEANKTEPVAAPAPAGAAAGFPGGKAQTITVNGLVSGKSPATGNAGALAQNRSFDRLTTQTNSVQPVLAASQSFVQAGVSGLQNLFKNNTVSSQATPVLQSFQVQQNGDALSVVDRDGSIYHGSVQPETATVRNEPAPAETFATRAAPPQSQVKAAQPAGNEQPAAQNYFFRVAGMNRTLKQNVVFTGNVLANSGAPQTAQSGNSFGSPSGGGGAGGNQLQQAAANAAQQSLLSNSRIVGTAVIASTNQIEINAVPVIQ